MTSPVIGIVGWSGSGKTTLLEALLPLLAINGSRVNVIKHTHHDVLPEPSQKDSARLRAAGAADVMLSSPHRYVITHELRNEAEPTLEALLKRLTLADMTLVEGYKWAEIPKLEVYRPSLGKPPLYLDDPHIMAVASDAPKPTKLSQQVAWLDLNQPQQVLAWLLALVQGQQNSCNS